MKSRRTILYASLLLVAFAIAAGASWMFRPPEFVGRLVYHTILIGVPEDPPPIVQLVTSTGTYDLIFSDRGRSDREFLRSLEAMTGKQVVVVGKTGVRRSPFMPYEHPAIYVRGFSLAK